MKSNVLTKEMASQLKTSNGVLNVPSGITRIASYAFKDREDIVVVYCPSTVTTIGEHCFENCKNLEQAYLSPNLLVLENRIFQNCVSLRKVVLHEGLASVGFGCFVGCNSLQEITFPNSVKSLIDASLFKNCDDLETINCSESLAYRFVVDPEEKFSSIPAINYYKQEKDAAGNACKKEYQLEYSRGRYLLKDLSKKEGEQVVCYNSKNIRRAAPQTNFER